MPPEASGIAASEDTWLWSAGHPVELQGSLLNWQVVHDRGDLVWITVAFGPYNTEPAHTEYVSSTKDKLVSRRLVKHRKTLQ